MPKPPPDDDDLPEPRNLRALRRLVTLLTATIIVGLAVVAGAMVVRLARDPAPAAPAFGVADVAAKRLALPAGETVSAAGAAPGALILVTRDAGGAERLRLYDAATGALLRVVAIERQ